MSQAQDAVFDSRYYQPAVRIAIQYSVSTPLGLACIYDTMLQGGLMSILEDTQSILGRIGEHGIEEESWLATFLDQREAFLNRIANNHEVQGKHASAQMLRTSIFRVRELRTLLQSGNMGLEGELMIRQIRIPGIAHPQDVAEG